MGKLTINGHGFPMVYQRINGEIFRIHLCHLRKPIPPSHVASWGDTDHPGTQRFTKENIENPLFNISKGISIEFCLNMCMDIYIYIDLILHALNRPCPLLLHRSCQWKITRSSVAMFDYRGRSWYMAYPPTPAYLWPRRGGARDHRRCAAWPGACFVLFHGPFKASKASEAAIWHVFSNPPSSFRRAFAALPWVLPRPHKLFLLGFETAIWHFRSATSCFYWVSKLLSGTFSAPLKSLKTLKTLAAAFDGLSLLCHGTSRGPTSCFCWASKMLSDTSEAPRAVSIGLRNCYLARCSFRRPFAALPWVLPRPHKLFLSGFETAIWHVFSTP